MDPRQLLRPLPLLAAGLFVAVAAVDIVLKATTTPLPIPELLEEGSWSFELKEPVFDLRSGGKSADRSPGNHVRFVRDDDWQTDDRGAWMVRDGAALDVELPSGDIRSLLVEGRSARGKARAHTVGITVNGRDCGAAGIDSGWSVHEIELAAGTVVPGRNRVEFRLPDRDGGPASGRAAVVKRLGFFTHPGDATRLVRSGAGVSIDPDQKTVTIRRSGTLRVPFEMHERVDALVMAYRFGGSEGRAELFVDQRSSADANGRPGARRSLSPLTGLRGRVRVPLHGRHGQFELRVEADLGEPAAPLTLIAPRLKDEDVQSSD